ncbi:hypothetical protein NBRC116188_18880 [Oceaniserpentilla sp. 4NH20-0058]|uniref:hypothetical protein n=1 Tax=Oceaniserpentilla sp. 4NH20-0058 TaxID=3127660 RepID=UPI0031092AA5
MARYAAPILLLFISICAQAIEPEKLKPAISRLVSLSQSADIIEIINTHSKPQTIRYMLKMDQLWRTQEGISDNVLDPAAQKILQSFMAQNSNFFIEVILIGQYGETLGSIPKTSDYWQGDEAKFKQVMGYDEVFIDALRWDESTQTISAQISVPIYFNRDIIGVLTGAVEASLKALGNAKFRSTP